MKFNVNLGSELKHVTNLTYSPTVPVVKDNEIIGKCTIDSEGNGEVNIVNEEEIKNIQNILELGVGGSITSREGNLITGFDLKEVSIQWNEKYKVSPSREREILDNFASTIVNNSKPLDKEIGEIVYKNFWDLL